MKAVLWSGTVIAVLCVLCLCFSFWVAGSVEEVEELARECVMLIEEERYVAASSVLEAARSRWEGLERPFSAAMPHGELTGVSLALARLSAFVQEEDREEALAQGQELLRYLEELRLRELPLAENIF